MYEPVWVFADADYDGTFWVYAAFTTEAAAEATKAHAGYGEVRCVEVHDEPILSPVIWHAHIVSRLGPNVSTYRDVLFPWDEDAHDDQVREVYPGDWSVLVYAETKDEARRKATAIHDDLIAEGKVGEHFAELHRRSPA